MTRPGSGGLLGAPLLDEWMVEALSDEAFTLEMVRVEVELAAAQAAVGVIPEEAAREIEEKARDWSPSIASLRVATARHGVPVSGLVRELRRQVGGTAADWVHWGATSQDILDTALVLRLNVALEHLEAGLRAVCRGLASLATEHRDAVMSGRTLGQAAVPTTFGYKAASWLAGLVEDLDRLHQLRPRLLVVQLGGAAGTTAALGEAGPAVAAALAERLDLRMPPCPWHTRRESLAELAGWLSLVTGGLGKMGQDLALLSQTGVDEVRESGDRSRGGSSTMPHKQNPVLGPRLIAAARLNASLVGAVHQALLQENERGTHGMVLESLSLLPMLHATAGALVTAQELLDGLVVRRGRMADNVAATRGALLAESAMLRLARDVGREEATARVRTAFARAEETGQHLIDVLAQTEDEAEGSSVDWAGLRDESEYLGSAGAYIDRVLERATALGIEITTEDR